MFYVEGLENLKYIVLQCIKLGQENPRTNPDIIAESLIKELKKKIIKRIK